MKKSLFLFLTVIFLISCKKEIQPVQWSLPILKTNNHEEDTLSSVFQIALGDITTNVRIRHNDTIGEPVPLLFAGLDYTGAWTRDASINVWNGAGLLMPDVAKNSLLELLGTDKHGNPIITGQYWDKIIWANGAWNYYLYTGDKKFLFIAYNAVANTINILEREEFDSTFQLFRGPAVYGDGISAYDNRYTATGEYHGGTWLSNIDKWAEANPTLKTSFGEGMPMMCLSTNAVYYESYIILGKMEKELEVTVNPRWQEKALVLKKAINETLWDKDKGTYNYYVDSWGKCNYQEGLGISLVILFDIASEVQRESIFRNTFVAPAGIPCVWPAFPRYTNKENTSFGRHSGTVWTHIQGFWAHAASLHGKDSILGYELKQLTNNTWRDKQFKEIYHPFTSEVYGGMQEDGHVKDSMRLWKSTDRQTWGATAFVRMILMGIVGMNFDETGITFQPCIPREYENLRLVNLRYRNALLSIMIKGKGTEIETFSVNNVHREIPFISKDEKGNLVIMINMKNNNKNK